ncbi:AraC family transcriptional regulator ligand-binding domain-containing protein [Alteromonas sp. A081]|uniref:AraC family transcriptional regulator n=1 Tax=Alteromonas sp. A081 TaxID=3410269 RepID=UPI003B9807F3
MTTQPDSVSMDSEFSLLGVTDKHLTAWPLAQAMIDIGTSQGIANSTLLRGTGLFLEDLANGSSLSAKQLMLLSQRVQKNVKSRDTGLQIGRMLTTSHMLGILSLMLRCRNLAHCVDLLSQIRWACMPLIHWRTYHFKGTVYLIPQDSFGAKEHWPFLVEIVFAWMVSVIRQGTGKRFPVSFEFAWARPRNIYDYEEFLGTRLRFDQPITMMKIPQHAWEASFTLADDDWVATGIAPFVKHPLYALPERVQSLLLKQPDITAAQIAVELSMSLATFKRRLAEHNMSFKQLSDDIQKQHAIMMVQTCKANTQQLADAFSVNDTTNLRRFIKRLTGMTLTQIRDSIS